MESQRIPPPAPFSPRRELGRTGFVATALGIGDLADRGVPMERCVDTARRALRAGLNVIDTAPNYEDGYSEEIVGRAVEGVREQVEQSLGRLRMDHADAFVLHDLSSMETLERAMRPGGAFDQVGECMAAGRMRFRGISSHHPEVLRVAMEAGLCDLVMFPVGPFVDARYVDQTLPLARRLGIGTVCFKAFGAGKLLGDTVGYNQPLQLRPRGKLSSGGEDRARAVLPRLDVEECLHYTLTLDPDVALLGLSFANEQDRAFAAARSFAPLPPERMADVRRRAAEARRGKGPCWWNPDPDA